VNSGDKTVRFTVKNTGSRKGTEIAEVYARLPQGADEPYKRLVGWQRVELAPGESRTVTVTIDARPLQTFNEANESWSLASGSYQVLVGPASDNTPLEASLAIR
jgi:beta-glucosidase